MGVFFLWRAREPASFVARLATRPGAHFTPPAPENMVAATIHAAALAEKPRDDETHKMHDPILGNIDPALKRLTFLRRNRTQS